MSFPKRFNYRPSLLLPLLGIPFFGGASAMLIDQALSNQNALNIVFIHLSPSQATTFFWALAGMSLFFVSIGLWSLIARFFDKRHVILDEEELFLPQGGLRKKQTKMIPYNEITALRLKKLGSLHIITIDYNNRQVSLSDALVSKKELLEIFDHIEERINSDTPSRPMTA